MRKILLLVLLVLIGIGAALLPSKRCTGDDCNYGRRCYTTSQCKCGLSCRAIRGGNDHDPFAQKACQF
jgi:hypothetical protein